MENWKAASCLCALLLSGCVQTSDLYALRQWGAPKTLQPDDRPRLNLGSLEPKASFVRVVIDECSSDHIGDVDHQSFATGSWAINHKVAAVCVQHIAAYAADQCIMITRRQNVVAADANLALGAVTLGTGAAALVDALRGPTVAKDQEALLASAAASSNTSRGFLPTTANVKVADLLGGALQYAEFIGLTDDDIKNALLYPTTEEHGRRSVAEVKAAEEAPQPAGDFEMVKLARVHDAVFAACGANAYGLVPARKPYK